jgi:FlhB-like protein
MSDKTEQPTPRRLRRAREQGDHPVSQVLAQSVGFVAAVALLPPLFAALAAGAGGAMMLALRGDDAQPGHALWLFVQLSLPLLAAAALVAAALGFLQTGGHLGVGKLAPDLARLNPMSGIRGLWNAQRFVSLLRSLLAAALILWLSFTLLRDRLPEIAGSTGRVESIAELSWWLSRHLLWWAALLGLALGGLDWFFVRRAWLERNKMSKDEVRREYRESEGDPEIKAARRRAHQEVLTGATIAAVKDATVLIVNPTHLATALRYNEQEDEAPEVVAQGEGELARKLIEAAHAYGVPVVRDVPIAHALRELSIGDQIPEALYEAVAEVLRELYERQGSE